MNFDRGKERLFGLEEIWEENEREESEDVREAMETAIVKALFYPSLSLCISWESVQSGMDQGGEAEASVRG